MVWAPRAPLSRSSPVVSALVRLPSESKAGARTCRSTVDPSPAFPPNRSLEIAQDWPLSSGEEEQGFVERNPASMWPQKHQQSEWRNSNHPFWQHYQRQQQWKQDEAFVPRELPQAAFPPVNTPRYIGDGTRRPSYGARVSYDQERNWNQRDNRKWQENRQGGGFVRDDTRRWLAAKEMSDSSKEKFLFLSYNILSADNARDHYRELYYHIPMRFVKWDWRKVRLTQEIEFWSPDILCLQEVDRFSELQDELIKRGYAGVFKRRTGAATDGCAIFWREKRFLLMEEETIEFKEYGLRDNVGQLCVLQSTREAVLEGELSGTENRFLVVANTHVLFNPKRGDIKLGQVRTLLNAAHELSTSWGGAQVIIGGDFNSTPSSPLYRYISTSELDVSGLDRRSISGQLADGEGGGYRQNFFPRPWRKSSSSVTVESKVTVHTEAERKPIELGISTGAAVEQEEETKTEERPLNQLMVIKTITDSLVVQESFENTLLFNKSAKVHFDDSCDGDDEETLALKQETVTEEEETPVTKQSTTADDEVEVEGDRELSSPQRVELFSGWTGEELENATGSLASTKVLHSLKLSSAYSKIQENAGNRDAQGEPLATTYHKKFRGTVDYIWHTEGLRPLRVVDLLPVDVLRQTGGLPSQKWGSDHLALVCEMEFL